MPPKKISPKIHSNARVLRHRQTDAENKLWAAIRAHQTTNTHFRRQHPVGDYIVDFCAPRRKLIIELDGGQHLEQERYDEVRTRYLESKGYRVLRIWNDEVLKNLDGVIDTILDALSHDLV
jgi:very-short-patch-repair endonuclease